MSAAVETHDQAHHEEGDHHGHHHPFQAHHFETMQQQFDSGKLGIWLFLFTEILMFSGLFCAYIIYRYNHPEVFLFAHKYLDTTLGALNTVVLIVSSLTMALAVRAAQKSQQKLLVAMLTCTLILAGVFLVVKYFEYTHKFDIGLYTGRDNISYQLQNPSMYPEAHDELIKIQKAHAAAEHSAEEHTIAEEEKAAEHPSEHSSEHSAAAGHDAGEHGEDHGASIEALAHAPRNTQIFFGIYYMMTGLHGFHILAGMVAISWLLYRSIKGHFSASYFGPVDYVGLYWHLVDLIWIYLFPLLYLIRS
ncbi:cytochrome c oxidase subunit 3 family protein [bacterium]|nr:cytochrome c oxidase subunit 3 family protein [bacterium]